MIAGRDSYIDFVRGLLMLSVIHIHTVYWSLAPVTPDVVRHLAYLMDIPIFFFISGYLFRNTAFLVSARSAWRQFLRLYLHYVVLTFLAACGILLWLHFREDRMEPQVGAVLFSIWGVRPLGRMWGYLQMYRGNLWYIQTYFSLLALAPFLVGLPIFRKARGAPLALVLLGYVWIRACDPNRMFLLAPAGQVLFYALFFVLGAMVRAGEREWGSKAIAISLGLNVLLAGLVFHADGNTLILEPYKFPPTFPYLVYSMLLVHVFLLAKPHWNRVKTPVVAPVIWAGRHSFELYLIQGAACSLPFFFADRLGTDNPWALYAMVYGFNVLVSFGLTWLYVAAGDAAKAGAAAVIRRAGKRWAGNGGSGTAVS